MAEYLEKILTSKSVQKKPSSKQVFAFANRLQSTGITLQNNDRTEIK